MTMHPSEVSDAVLDLAKDLCGRGAADSAVATAMLRIAVALCHAHVLRKRREEGYVSLAKIGPEQVEAITLEAMDLIGERLDDAEADLAERN